MHDVKQLVVLDVHVCGMCVFPSDALFNDLVGLLFVRHEHDSYEHDVVIAKPSTEGSGECGGGVDINIVVGDGEKRVMELRLVFFCIV